MTRAKRQRAEKRGRWAEYIAIGWLRAKGYQILERRLDTPLGEIDLIACKRGIIAFIEVKYRQQQDTALEAVTRTSWSRISRAAEYWMARRPQYSDHGWRYDLMALTPRGRPIHLRDSWRPGLA